MTLIIANADCMASPPASNPYGQPPHKPLPTALNKAPYSPDDQQTGAGARKRQQQPMPHDGTPEPSFTHSGSLFASYDGLSGGMASDSELTTSASTRHHHYHHRPYSSQSRVYHAHPLPRSSPASSRLSHYSDSSAPAATATTNIHRHHHTSSAGDPYASHLGQQQQQQQQISAGQPINIPPPAQAQSSTAQMAHQGSLASSTSSASSGSGMMPPPYLSPGVISSESPISPILSQSSSHLMRPQSGRQLPQRPFKQSISIDQHSLASGSIGGNGMAYAHHTAANQVPASSPAHRNLADLDQVANYPQAQHQSQGYPAAGHHGHQRFNPQHHSSSVQYGSTGHVRNLRLEMEFMEKQTANLNLYDPTTNENPAARLPPSGSTNRQISTSSTRQLPTICANQSQGLIGSMSLDQTNHHQVDPFQQHQHQQQQAHLHQRQRIAHQDPNAAPSHQQHHHNPHHAHQLVSASTDWQLPVGMSNQQQHQLQRTVGGQFKQAVSIDHYTVGSNVHQQYTPSTNYGGEQYQLERYQSGGPQSSVGYDAYYPTSSSQSDNQTKVQDNYYSSKHQQPLIESNNQLQQQTAPSDYPTITGRSGSNNSSTSLQNQVGRPILHHQISSSSSNSNQSSPQKSSQANSYMDKQPTASASGHNKTYSHGGTPIGSMGYQHSPQHHTTPTGRPDMLRRGYTSLAMTSDFGSDLGGSQTALSESGDFSHTQTNSSHGAQISSLNFRRSGLRAASPSVTQEAPTPSGSGQHHRDQHHSTSSCHGGRDASGLRSESSTGLPNGANESSTLTKKSNSATQLSMTGTKKRLGFRKKQVTSFSVHRSEEVAPLEARHLVKQGSSVSEGDSSVSGDSSSRSWSNSNFRQQNSEELASMSFIDGLGKGQMISRQGLASPYLGDIQLSLCDRRGNLEIEVIRARNLQAKTTKVLPLTYVKLYLVKNRKCLAKAKTTLSNKRTLNPLFQQQLTFHEDYHGCILQSIVWGNFGKMDKKNFMGIAQISIDDLELSDTVISWYKLFLPSSLQTLPSKSLRHTLLSNSTESFTNTNNS